MTEARAGNPGERPKTDTTKQDALTAELKAMAAGDPGEPKVVVPEKIERTDLKPRDIKPGETEIVLQRHGKYERDPDHPETGSLGPEAQADELKAAEDFFRKQLDMVPEGERDKVKLLVIASDTQYMGGGKRSTETANIVLTAARGVLKEYGLSTDQILNQTHNVAGGPEEARPTNLIREPKIFDGSEKSEEFRRFLEDKYGANKEYGTESQFFQAFEGDWEKEKREELGVEGPGGLADRLKRSIDTTARYARIFHSNNPGERLIIWAATHYDTISPYAKRELVQTDDRDMFLGVDYGAGISIKIDEDGRGETSIGDTSYEVPLKRP